MSSDGILTANNAVIRGRIEADSGYFNGLIKASRIEGDVMKVHRMRKLSDRVWELELPADELPRMIKPDFSVVSDTTYQLYHKDNFYIERRKVKAALLLNGEKLKSYETQEVYDVGVKSFERSVRHGGLTYDARLSYRTRVDYAWHAVAAGKPVVLRLELADYETVDAPVVLASYLSPFDWEYKALAGTLVWRTFKDEVRFEYPDLMKNVGAYQKVSTRGSNPSLGKSFKLPDNIYGLSFEYRVNTNSDWACGLHWDRSDAMIDAKAYDTTYNEQFKAFSAETNGVAAASNILFSASRGWQWAELRNIRVLIPEFRKNEVW